MKVVETYFSEKTRDLYLRKGKKSYSTLTPKQTGSLSTDND